MAFWSSNSIEPLRKNRFLVYFDGTLLNNIKTVSKPKYETDVREFKLMNQIIKIPTVPKWADVTMKIVDTKQQRMVEKLYSKIGGDPKRYLKVGGVNLPVNKDSIPGGVVIEQYDASGNIMEVWTLVHPFIRSVDFGEGDYKSDEFAELTVIIGYDYATLGEKNKASVDPVVVMPANSRNQGDKASVPPSTSLSEEEQAALTEKLETGQSSGRDSGNKSPL